jgi:hypothetical protein
LKLDRGASGLDRHVDEPFGDADVAVVVDADLGYHETRRSVPKGFASYFDHHLVSPTHTGFTRLIDSGLATD